MEISSMSHARHDNSFSAEHRDRLVALRQSLHRHPDIADGEQATAESVQAFLNSTRPDDILTGIGGAGLAVVYNGSGDGPTVLLRAELDALPIEESIELPYRSATPGISHKCGHDGHMAILAGICGLLHQRPPQRGRVILLFQPAEETGRGARRVLADPKFRALSPDFAFALHNLPGKELGKVYLKSGTMTCASVGLAVALQGRSAHASQPEQGLSPAGAMCDLVQGLPALARDTDLENVFSLVTVVHARLGDEAFGTAPGHAKILATLRSESDAGLKLLKTAAAEKVTGRAKRAGLETRLEWMDDFAAGVNHEEAVQQVARAAAAAGQPLEWLSRPFRWSEDFGQFTARVPGALFVLGAGETVPPLHSPDYDFPDDLIEPGVAIFRQLIDQLLNETKDSPQRRRERGDR
jgi:amidohydrolase